MSKLPPARQCIFAEQVRPEPDGRSTILGFIGVAPYASIFVPQFPVIINLAAFVLCEPPKTSESPDLELEVIGPAGLSVIPRMRGNLPPPAFQGNMTCALNFQTIHLAQPGRYTVKLYSESKFHSEHSLTVNAGPVPLWK